MKKLFLVLVVIVLAIPLIVAQAAKPGCRTNHTVRQTDTLRSLSVLYKIDPWWIVKANVDQAEAPNRPIYLGSRLCIPSDITGKPKKLAAYILDQPPADFYPRLSGKQITISAYNFARGSIWLVKLDGKKLKGTFKVSSKSVEVKSFIGNGKILCLKNIRTDFSICRKVILPIR